MTNGVKGKDLPKFILAKQHSFKVLVLACACVLAFVFSLPILAADNPSRTHIYIVGSSIVHPYTQAVSKAFTDKTKHPAPVVKNSGSSSGIVKFCKGVGLKYPDIANSSRPMTKEEWELCKSKGVDDITEIRFGNDGITLIKSRFGESLNLTRRQLYEAIALKIPVGGKLVNNPNRTWSDIDGFLPDVAIQIFGPTITHGTYGTFVNKALTETCENDLEYFKKKRQEFNDAKKFQNYLKTSCSRLRFDGAYIGADQTIKQIKKLLITNASVLVLVGYADLFNARSSFQAVRIAGVEPRIYTISDGSYPLSRPLYFYIKNAHRERVPGLSEFAKEFMSDNAMSPFGYLVRMGLGVLSVEELLHARYAAVIGEKMRRYAD